MSKFMSAASAKTFWNPIGHFIGKMSIIQRNIILKGGDNIITNTPDLCAISY